jgi:thiamine-monophosphate kinase
MELSTELGLIADIKKWTQSVHCDLIGDDCAVLSFDGPVLASTDSLVENVHFKLSTTSLFDLGYKSAAVNLSDIAAMSGKPRQILVGLILPGYITREHLSDFYAGLTDCCSRYDTAIAGGNLASGKQFSINITVLGQAHPKGIAKRSTAQDGDVIVVSGDFGASAAGFNLLNCTNKELQERAQSDFSYCLKRHTKPEPRLALSWQMIEQSSRISMMDTSDGLADALLQMSRASGVTFEIDPGSIAIHSKTQELASILGANALDWALYGGEDYELLACIPEMDFEEIKTEIKDQLRILGRVKKNGESSVKLIQTADSKWNESLSCLNMDKIFNHFDQSNPT